MLPWVSSSPTVTVVVPCYKYGKHVTDCVQSLLANTLVNLDILVIDDASPDDSWSVVQRLPELDPRIRVRRNESNQGLIRTANSGVMSAPGEYVVLLSADDALTPGWLDRGVAALERNPKAVMAYGPTRRFSGTLPKLHVNRAVETVVHPGHEWIERCCTQGITPVLSPEVIVRTSAQLEVGGYNPALPYCSDMEMWLRLASIGDVVWVGGAVAAFYRVSPHSMSRGIYVDLLKGLQVRKEGFDAWYESADALVPNRDDLMAKAKQSMARIAVKRARKAFWQDRVNAQFDSICDYALENDPVWAAPEVERLRALRERRALVRVRNVGLPLAKMSVRARGVAADVRARLHMI
jgi:glycosyltransferase involved in cell wall biosynthesis